MVIDGPERSAMVVGIAHGRPFYRQRFARGREVRIALPDLVGAREFLHLHPGRVGDDGGQAVARGWRNRQRVVQIGDTLIAARNAANVVDRRRVDGHITWSPGSNDGVDQL